MVQRSPRPMAALYAAVALAASLSAPRAAGALLESDPRSEQPRALASYSEGFGYPHPSYSSSHDLDVAVLNSDPYAESVVTISPTKTSMGIGEQDHARITSILDSTRELIDAAHDLIQHERTLKEGQDMMAQANDMFRQVKDIIRRKHEEHSAQQAEGRDLLRKRYADHDLERAEEDGKRWLDLTRKMYETMVTFPECVEQLLEDCISIINGQIAGLGLSTIELVVHEKRNVDQDGYNKVVIITNELADRVLGRGGDGYVSYPFMWNDSLSGLRTVGVDGKWSCRDETPEVCCAQIKASVPNPDTRGNNIECHIFVPYGGVGNPRRNDRVFVNLSPDGRVHEPPVIQ